MGGEMARGLVPIGLDQLAGFLQTLEERSGDVLVVTTSGLGNEEPDHRHRCLLRPRHERPSRCARQPPSR
jgi:hypothetical protein